MGHGGGRADGRRGRRKGDGFFRRRIPDREPRDAGVEWVGARRAPARVPGNSCGPGAGRVAESGRLREGSKILMEGRASPPGRLTPKDGRDARRSTVIVQTVQLLTWVRLFLNARSKSGPTRCGCRGVFFFSPKTRS